MTRPATTHFALAAGLRMLAVLGVAILAAHLLAGCGGGDPEDEPDQPTPSVDCQAKPQACK